MGIMTTLVMNYTVNPIWNTLRKIARGMMHSQMVMGYSRAAAELARQGYYEEAKEVMMRLTELKKEK